MRRNDAKRVYDVPVFNNIFPFILKRRSDSLVYHNFDIDVTKAVEYVREYNSKNPKIRLKFFYLVCASLLRTIALRPELNRFIAAERYWQRNELSLTFVVKESLTDDAPETSYPIIFDPSMTLDQYAEKIDSYISNMRMNMKGNSKTDKTIATILNLPVWLIGIIIWLGKLMERLGIYPKFLRYADGLHSSVYISNLGSIGIEGGIPYHHLYEWGTTSLFITVGGLERKRQFDKEGKITSTKETLKIGVTLDERVSSGFYFIKSMKLFQSILNDPSVLEQVPVLPPPPLTKKQYFEKLRKEKELDQSKS